MRRLLPLILLGMCFGQYTVPSHTTTVGVSTGVALPLNWVNNLEYIATSTNTINFPASWMCDSTVYGPYTVDSQASLQVAINNAEACRAVNGSGTKIILPHGHIYSGTAGITLPQSTGDTSPNFIIITSDAPLPAGQTVCSHGIQDNVPASTQPGIRNLGCNGAALSYQLGTVVTPVTMSGYNDLASMYTIENTTGNNSVIQTGTWDTNNIGPHHYAILNGEFRYTLSQFSGTHDIIRIGQGQETLASQIPTHIHVGYSYLHGDWTDAPVSNGVATGPPTGNTSLPNDINFVSCINCSFTYSYVDKSLRPASEGHCWAGAMLQIFKVAHVWCEGSSTGSMIGGRASDYPIQGFDLGQDVEDRGNRYTYPYSWLLAKNSGFIPSSGNYVRKNAHEVKAANRYLFDGNIAENQDNSGVQSGQSMEWGNRNSANGVWGNNYWIKANHITVSNNVLRNGCVGPLLGTRSTVSTQAGAGIAEAPQYYAYINNLLYNTSSSNPGCQGANPAYGFRIGGQDGSFGSTWSATTATSDTNGIVTLILASEDGGHQTDTNLGDPVQVSGCSDVSFNTNVASLGPPALNGTNHDGLTIVYKPTSATPSSSATGCVFSNKQGYIRYFTFTHNTDVTDRGKDPNNGATSCASTVPGMQARNVSMKDSLLLNGIGFQSCYGEGTRTQVKILDTSTFIFNHVLLADRDAQVTCPGHLNPAPGGMAVCYTEYSDTSIPSIPATLYGTTSSACSGSDPTTQDCAGILGAMSTTVFPFVLPDWHNYRLCHAGDVACNGNASQYAAGGTRQATDGSDMGMDPIKIDAAQTSTLYTCTSFCGTGPFPDK